MKKKTIGILIAAALLSVSAVGIGQAYAYFTTNTAAVGSQQIRLGDRTTITESEVVSGRKTVVIHNNEESGQAVWVRAKALAGNEVQKGLTYEGNGWQLPPAGSSEWAYCTEPVEPGGETTSFTAKVVVPKPKTGEETFNVVIVYETTPAVRIADDQGNTTYAEAGWDKAASEGGENS
ncbi:MAG: hypothetical protein IKE31_00785 [Eubacterium sp.]|nr:hypothetical protein [Eubacterium sp.]